MFIDSHCHLNFPELASQLPAILEAMQQAKVGRALCISTQLETFESVYALARDHEILFASVGVHPDNEGVAEPSVEALVELAARPKVVAIGETGLDYFRLGEKTAQDLEWQRERFRVHIRAARISDKPLVIHSRSAAEDTLQILDEEGLQSSNHPTVRGVFHCFTESKAVAEAALDRGFYISFSGIVTFKNAQSLREIAAFVPPNRILIETDSPYLAPHPHRGQTNTPAFVPLVAQTLAESRGTSIENIAEITTQNFHSLFRTQ